MKNYQLILCLILMAVLLKGSAINAEVCNTQLQYGSPTNQYDVNPDLWDETWMPWNGSDRLPFTVDKIQDGVHLCGDSPDPANNGNIYDWEIWWDRSEADNETDTGFVKIRDRASSAIKYTDPYLRDVYYCGALHGRDGAPECQVDADCPNSNCFNELVSYGNYINGNWYSAWFNTAFYGYDIWTQDSITSCKEGDFILKTFFNGEVRKEINWYQYPSVDLTGNEENYNRGQESMDGSTKNKGNYVITSQPNGEKWGYADQCVVDGGAVIPCSELWATDTHRPATIKEAGCSFMGVVQSIENYLGKSIDWKNLYDHLYTNNDQGENGFLGVSPEVDIGQGKGRDVGEQGSAIPRIRQALGNYNLCWKPCDRTNINCQTLQEGLPIVSVGGHITNVGGTRQDGKWVEYSTTYAKMLDILTEEDGWNDNLQYVEDWGCFTLTDIDCPDIPNDDVEITTTCGGA